MLTETETTFRHLQEYLYVVHLAQFFTSQTPRSTRENKLAQNELFVISSPSLHFRKLPAAAQMLSVRQNSDLYQPHDTKGPI